MVKPETNGQCLSPLSCFLSLDGFWSLVPPLVTPSSLPIPPTLHFAHPGPSPFLPFLSSHLPPLSAVFSSSPAIWAPTEPPKKKRSVVLDEILEQLEDSESDSEEQTLQLRTGTERVRVRGSRAPGTGDSRSGFCAPAWWARERRHPHCAPA